MAKSEARQGPPTPPTGQPRRGTLGEQSVNPKSFPTPDSLGVSTPTTGQPHRGFLGEDSANQVKSGGSLASADEALTGHHSYDSPPLPSTSNPGANRQRYDIDPNGS